MFILYSKPVEYLPLELFSSYASTIAKWQIIQDIIFNIKCNLFKIYINLSHN